MAEHGGWKRVGELLVARRAQLGYPRRAAFLRAKDATRFERILGDLEAGNRDNYEPGTLAYAEHIYEWLPGSITQVLAGGDPTTNTVDMQRKITEGVREAFGDDAVAKHTVPVGAGGEGEDDEDPVLFLLTAEENQRLGRLPADERRRVLDAARAAARATADALLGTGDEE